MGETAKRKLNTKAMTLIGLMTAVTCVIAPFAVPLPFTPVPVTLGTFILYLSVYLLGTKKAMVSCALYLIIGFLGLPVFSGFSGGIGRLAGPTGGYMVGYLFLVFMGGSLADKLGNKLWQQMAALSVGTAVCYLFGTIWLCIQMELDPAAGFSVAVLPYLPLDLIKIVLAAVLGPKIAAAVKRAI